MTQRQRGFTLIEVLVALVVTATALVTGMRAASALAGTADRQSQFMLAQLCAENSLVQLRLARRLPDTGTSGEGCTQGERSFQVEQNVYTTPNTNFRRVELVVKEGGRSVTQISAIIGRN